MKYSKRFMSYLICGGHWYIFWIGQIQSYSKTFIILKLKKGRVVTDLRHFFTETVINIWNHLASSVVEAQTINLFKFRLQKIHDTDESFFGRYTSHWLRKLSQFPGEAWTGELILGAYVIVFVYRCILGQATIMPNTDTFVDNWVNWLAHFISWLISH